MSFKIIKKSSKSLARIGKISTSHGEVKTPCFMPIATKGAVKNLTPDDLKSMGADLILGNTYHLWLRPGLKVINKIGGLHQFMNWSSPILTDSGGYQIFSLENKIRNQSAGWRTKIKMTKKKFKNNQENFTSSVKISDEGAEFRDPFNGQKYFLTPEKAIEIQLKLGADIIMVLDECPPYPCAREQAKKAAERTTDWARRCKKFFIKYVTYNLKNKKRPLLFGIIQGSVYQDLREQSAREIMEIGFDGYAIGGVAVGEPRNFLPRVLNWVLPLLPENKPRYLMGLGRPEEIVMAVKSGIDLFDCVIPTREARHGRLYKFKIQKSKINPPTGGHNSKFYKTINILNSKYRLNKSSINETNLKSYSFAYLHHLFRLNESLAMRLATLNNLNFYLSLIAEISQAIKKNDK